MQMLYLALFAVGVAVSEGTEQNAQEDRVGEKVAEDVSKGAVSANMLGGTLWDWDRCVAEPCKEGEGDCDSDAECKAGLTCGHNNCKTMHPAEADLYMTYADCCEVMQPFHLDYCQEKPGCGFGVGDCDDDDQCGAGLVCGYNNCRAMHARTDPVLIHHRADCCTTCAAVTVVLDGIPTPQPPMSFVGGKLVTAERTLANPPSVLAGSVVHSLPSLSSDDEIKLECCAKKNTPCNFFVAVYHCPPCSATANGGIPNFLASQGWSGSSCAPIFTPAGSSQAQTMTVFQKTLQAGEDLTIPLSTAAPHVAVFTTGGVGDWCPNRVATGTKGPNRPCVCL
eukprot:TRINITY_DN273_c0_g1_i11.p1 TRINITY_DN273_c0_g1~~TRINITY_DN273_c0_g1_i11.p1  ORF type:complete len:337 (+),score=110.13 TRINITY_DN273_c0_g1_i11:69-1079(+)